MNPAEIFRRLWKEQHEWESYGEDPAARWTVRGIKLCIKHIHDIRKEMTYNERARKPTIHRWFAKDLHYAICMALRALGRGDRKKAVVILEKAKEDAERKVA